MLRRAVAALLCVVFLAGCGETSFLGRRYDNFTAYYNTFYNARKSFDRGVQALQQADQPINQDVFLAVYPVPTRAGNRQDFEDAIKKSADVIRDHPGSKWIDDAVLLIGKSYFYQQNFVSAAQKFREATALRSDLEDEARFWLGYALAANGSLLEARDELAIALDREELDPRWKPALNMLLGDVLVRLSEWDDAVALLRQGIADTRDREAEARARFLLGQLEEKRGSFQGARDAYASLRRLQPPFELAFAARLNELRLASRIGGIEQALGELRRLERDDKYRDRLARIAYARAQLLHEAGDARAARDAYSDLLYYSDYDVSSVRGRVHYGLGTIYRDAFEDFVLAAAHFDTASTVLQTPSNQSASGRPEPLTVHAISDSRQQATIHNAYARIFGEVTRMDSLLHLGSLPEEEFQDAIQDLRRRLQREMQAREREAERQRGDAGFVDGFVDAQQQAAAGASAAGTGSSTAGFLFHREPVRVQEGRQAFVRRWGDRPLVPGWRRRSSIDAYVAELRERSDGDGDAAVQQLIAETDASLPVVDVSDVPRTDEARLEMMRQRAMARYELANVLFISMERPDSAAAVYQLVMDEDADLPVAGRAFYALAELERSRGRIADANNLYRIVLERYPGSEFENRVREHLGMEVTVATDSLALAQAQFDELMRQWRDGDVEDSFTGLIRLSLDVDDERLAPAALMAASRIGIEWLRRDSLQLTHPLPVDISDERLTRAGLLYVDSSRTIMDATPDIITAADSASSISEGAAAPDTTASSGDASLISDEAAAPDTTTALDDASSIPDEVSVDTNTIRPRLLSESASAPPPTRGVTIEQLLTRLANTYSTSPLAPQARSMLSEIDARKPAPEEDLLASVEDAAPDDAPPADTASAAAVPSPDDDIPPADVEDADVLEQEPDVDEPEMMQTPVEGVDDDAFSLRGEGGIVIEAGGWTLLVAEAPDEQSAEEVAAVLRGEGFRTDILNVEDAETVNVYVGQFAQRGLAEVALRTHRDVLPTSATVVPVPGASDSP